MSKQQRQRHSRVLGRPRLAEEVFHTSLTLPKDLHDSIVKAANKEDLNVSHYIRRVLKRHFESTRP